MTETLRVMKIIHQTFKKKYKIGLIVNKEIMITNSYALRVKARGGQRAGGPLFVQIIEADVD